MALGVPRHISEMEMEKAFQMGCTLYFGFIYIYIYIYILSLTQFFTYTKKERKKMSKKTEGEILHLWAHQKFIKHKKKPSYFMNY